MRETVGLACSFKNPAIQSPRTIFVTSVAMAGLGDKSGMKAIDEHGCLAVVWGHVSTEAHRFCWLGGRSSPLGPQEAGEGGGASSGWVFGGYLVHIRLGGTVDSLKVRIRLPPVSLYT